MPFTRLPILVALLVLSSALTRAADIRVVSSGGFSAAYRTLVPQFEKTTGNHLITGWGPSMGTPQTRCLNGLLAMNRSTS
jgi:molybdate transport system substrate-binding protein